MPANLGSLTVSCPTCTAPISFELLLKDLDKAVVNLSPTEKIIAIHSAKGKSIKEISVIMHSSRHTVQTHLCNAYRKLHVRNQLDLAIILLNAVPAPVKGI